MLVSFRRRIIATVKTPSTNEPISTAALSAKKSQMLPLPKKKTLKAICAGMESTTMSATGNESGMAYPFARNNEYIKTDGKPKMTSCIQKSHPGNIIAAEITASVGRSKR